ncbi:glycosyltransferase [Flavobacterium sp. J372]|uniref:glycosyltransferase n=1 Tax=Flavobacterium sp. J372 TaxID=2898436 RepID=UPI002151762A|nr:glycosyltransferase [Flavobacterium sp. J372]MCR5861935.1 glycosyltransferase [Flavobacterium sp. J372]
MKILLIGEFSRLHNSLKEGLVHLGHSVTIASTGDSFKKYDSDLSYYPAFILKNWLTIKINNILFSLFGLDCVRLEKGLRFYLLLKKLKGFDHVQLINSDAIETYPAFSRWLYKRLLKQNGDSLSLLICGEDTPIVDYHLERRARYSILTPYLEDKQLEKTYHYTLKYTTPAYRKLFNLVKHHADVMITTDLDYTLPMQEMGYKVTHIANPVNADKVKFEPVRVSHKIVIFLGINRLSYIKKGIAYFEEALLKISDKYADRIEIVVTENLPYAEYMKHYSRAHIVLDQIWGYDQGYNALEAMARGKVVFTCAEKEFMEYYGLTECVAINALPDADYIATELSYLIEHPEKIAKIAASARAFIEKEHNYIDVAKRYLEVWEK